MSGRIPPPATPAAALPLLPVAVAASSASAPSFAEAQRRLADRRHERAAADAAQRGEAAAAVRAQREASAAALRARLDAATGGSGAASLPLVRQLGGAALATWDGASRVAATIGSQLSGDGSGGGAGSAARPAFRVSQVDAELLDEELLELLRGQVADALRYLRGGTLQDDWQPEIMLLLRAALFKLSVWDHDATYGAALQNLRFADARAPSSAAVAAGGKLARARRYYESSDAAVPIPPSKWQKALYGLVTVGGRYAWTKWEDWLRDHHDGEEGGDDGDYGYDNENDYRQGSSASTSTPLSTRAVRRLARATTIASDMYAGAAFVSFLVFLRYGRYRTLLDRVLRMRLVPPTSQVSREVSFEYLNRQLVWHAFTEFLLFLLPLVGINRWRRWLTRTWRKTKSAVGKAKAAVVSVGTTGTTDTEGVDASVVSGKTGEYAFLPERTCAICYQDQNSATSEADVMAAAAASSGVIGSAETDVTNPYEAVPCGCVYCYVSLATRIEREEGDGWTCLRCGTLVTSCRPWSGDVLEPASAVQPAAGGADGARPSSSSTNASGGSPGNYTHKTVGFADDVKGEEEQGAEEVVEDEEAGDETDGSSAEIVPNEDAADEGSGSSESSESEAYEEDEDDVEGDFDE